MQFIQFQLADFSTGAAIPLGKCAVYLAGTSTPAALYDQAGNAIANPAVASSLAQVGFAAADGLYDFQPQYPSGASAGPKIVGQSLFDILSLIASFGLRPESYGAKGDGATNDTSAFQALAAAIVAAGGGMIILRPGATYLVGRASLVNNGTYMFRGEDILRIENCTKKIIIRGNGAKIKLAPGLKYGTFNSSGVRTDNAMPYIGGQASSPLSVPGALYLSANSGGILLEDFDLDGNVAALSIGGEWSTEATGRQIDGDGLFAQLNTGGFVSRNVKTYNWPRDGRQISATTVFAESGDDIPPNPHSFFGDVSKYNCRNNVSLIGGRNIYGVNCDFAHAGVASLPFFSPPAACMDVEAEHGSIRDVMFELSDFYDSPNGASFVAASGDTADILLRRCLLDNPANWAAYTGQPGVKLDDCDIFGAFHYIDPADTSRAGRFKHCRFKDKDGDSVTGFNLTFAGVSLFDGAGGGAHGIGVWFEDCSWDAHHLSPHAATSCVHQDSRITAVNGLSLGAYADNVFRGKTVVTNDFAITAIVEQSGVKVVGTIFGNGTQWLYITGAYAGGAIANGGRVTMTLFPPRAKIDQFVEAKFSGDLAGVKMFPQMSAAQTTKIYFENDTGGSVTPIGTVTVIVRDLDAA